jgi:hypothetical protein
MDMKVIQITTEGDCEGRSTKVVGLFTGSIEQIITHLVANNIKPYYTFNQKEIEVIDCSKVQPKVSVSKDCYGRLEYKTSEDLQREADKAKALAKLTKEERQLLGIA